MARRRHTPEQIITKLREAEVGLAQGRSVAQVCKAAEVTEVTEHTCFRWPKEYGGVRVTQAKRLRQLEGENVRMRRAVDDLTIEIDLKGGGKGHF